jgi:hypothetical protein
VTKGPVMATDATPWMRPWRRRLRLAVEHVASRLHAAGQLVAASPGSSDEPSGVVESDTITVGPLLAATDGGPLTAQQVEHCERRHLTTRVQFVLVTLVARVLLASWPL